MLYNAVVVIKYFGHPNFILLITFVLKILENITYRTLHV